LEERKIKPPFKPRVVNITIFNLIWLNVTNNLFDFLNKSERRQRYE
jgi:hypothetical protein